MKATIMICAAALALAAASPALAGKAVIKSTSNPMGGAGGVGACAKPGPSGPNTTSAPPRGGLATQDDWEQRCAAAHGGGSGASGPGAPNGGTATTPGVPNMDAGSHASPK
jgi:hypothetical protein